MGTTIYIKPDMLIALLFQQGVLQQQLIEMQHQVIKLQQHIDSMTPKNPPDEEVFWHISSDGLTSEAAAESDDLTLLKRFRDWNIAFAKHHIKPYVNPLVYGECMNQMTRGLATKIAMLETEQANSGKSNSGRRIIRMESRHVTTDEDIQQLALMP